MADESEKKEPTWRDAIVVLTLRLTDAGLAPWVAVALFLLAGAWLFLRNLDSKDTLSLLSRFGTLHGFAWLGWLVAFVEIPIVRWALKRERRMRNNKLRRIEDEHEKALEMLKKYKLMELKLES